MDDICIFTQIKKFDSSDDDRMNRRWIQTHASIQKKSSANIVAHGINVCQIQKLQIPFFSLLFLCRLYSIFARMTKKNTFFDNNVSGYKEDFFDSFKFDIWDEIVHKRVHKGVIENQIASTQSRIMCILCSWNNQLRVRHWSVKT